mmetsp:Transcript_13882/g.25548  ORF Transcript_13882/g.25548 Transcript_13882/m.25548 type:complete len:357 (+) Transcript_13882:66-1136(+)
MAAAQADEESNVQSDEAGSSSSTCGKYIDLFLHVMPPVLLIAVGIAFWMVVEKRDFLTSAYIITQIVTTIGYGDYTASTPEGRIFMAVYVLAALVVLAYYFNVFIGGCLERREQAMCEYLQEVEDSFLVEDAEDSKKSGQASRHGDMNKVIAAALPFLVCLLVGMAFFRFYEGYCTCYDGGALIDGCSMDTELACINSGGNIMTLTGSFYMSMITLTTVGFGDYHPNTRTGYVFAIVWMLVGVAATAIFTATLSAYLFDSEQKQQFVMSDFLDTVTDDVFSKIDRNGDGKLSRGEFLSFTLMKYGGVSEGLIEEINREFEATDTSGVGRVTYDMIAQRQAAIQSKLASVHKPLSRM